MHSSYPTDINPLLLRAHWKAALRLDNPATPLPAKCTVYSRNRRCNDSPNNELQKPIPTNIYESLNDDIISHNQLLASALACVDFSRFDLGFSSDDVPEAPRAKPLPEPCETGGRVSKILGVKRVGNYHPRYRVFTRSEFIHVRRRVH